MNYNASHEPDSGVEIQNVTTFLVYWNERLHWGLSENQIREYSKRAEAQILKNPSATRNTWFHISNLTRFDEELGAIIGLNDSRISTFTAEDQKQLELDHMNYFKETPFVIPEKIPPVIPSMNSATDTFRNEQTLMVTPRATSGFDLPVGIISLLMGLLMIASGRR